MKLLRTAVLFALVIAAGYWLPPAVRAVIVLSFCLAAFAHFALRIAKHRVRGRARASGVSLALAFLSLGPVVVMGVLHGWIPRRAFGLVELAAFVLATFLIVAILRVEQIDEARENRKKAALSAELERVLNDARRRDVGGTPTARRP